MPALMSRPRSFKIRCSFLRGKQYINVKVDPAGMIYLREPAARRWLEMPVARIYTLASIANPPRTPAKGPRAVLLRRSARPSTSTPEAA